MDSLITPLLTGLSALLCAWVGTYLGLRKFRQERAFVARLEWHRKLAETAKVLRNRTRAFGAFRREGTLPDEVALPLINDLSKLAFDFQEQTELSALYATKQTHAAIQGVLAQMTEAAQPFGKHPDPGDDPTAVTQQAQELYRTSMAGMERVYDLLARDLREMHGLQRLDEHQSLGQEAAR